MAEERKITYADMDLLRELDIRFGMVQDLKPVDWENLVPVTDVTTKFVEQWKETVEVVDRFRKLCKECHFKPK